jgi:hypothetical protein
MKFTTFRWQTGWAHTLALAALCANTAQAQPTPNAAHTTVALPYRSVFEGYQKFNDQPVAPWVQTNATVESIGGWRAYAKEAAQADRPAQADAAAALPSRQAPSQPQPQPVGHGGHGNHGVKP